MKYVRPLILCTVFLFCITGKAQIQISERIQKSSVASENDVSLYFIDFWATWCGPCINASKYLTVLQQQYPNDLHIVSLSQENGTIVKNFLKKHKLQLTAAIDNEGETFKKYNIHSLPYGVLLNANGAKIWEGHPADLKAYDVKKYLKRYQTRANFEDFFKVLSFETPVEEVYSPKKDFEFVELFEVLNEGLQINEDGEFVELKGRLGEILAYGWKINVNQIEIPDTYNKYYKFYAKKNSRSYRNLPEIIVKRLKLKTKTKKILGDVYALNMKSANLWDTFQIDWEDNPTRYLIGDADIKADNVSVNDMAYTLGKVLEKPVIVVGLIDTEKLHDWDIHYKYYDLMVSSLYDNYGIKLQKDKTEFTNYIITKKAP